MDDIRRNKSGLNIMSITNITQGNSTNVSTGNQTSTEVIHPIQITHASSPIERNINCALSLDFGLLTRLQ